MKIGVLTFWHGNANYGMMLQCWALQQQLKQMGHQPYVIRYATEKKKGLPRKILEFFGMYQFFLRFVKPEEYQNQRKKRNHDLMRQFESFRHHNLNLSPIRYKTLQKLQNNPPEADCYIVGSDQVWSAVLTNEENTAYFLNFGEKETKRISYAPSFGIDKYPSDCLNALKTSLSKFDALSCREQSGVEICKEVGYKAIKVLDPTMLLLKDSYIELASKCKALTPKPYIFIYSLNIADSEEIRFAELNEYRNMCGHDLVVTPGDGYCQGGELFGDETIYSYSTIEQWLANIVNSSLVVTPSFHGIVLSIILQKPFIYTPLGGSHSGSNSRITGLLHDLELQNRMLTDELSYSNITQQSIDWDSVSKKLHKLKQLSICFLQANINKN